MKIEKFIKPERCFIFLSWEDIDLLKKGNTVCERYDGEHKINIEVISETLILENWTDAEKVSSFGKFDEFLHDFFLNLSLFDVRFAFQQARNVKVDKNPFYKKVRIFFPI